MCIGCFWEDKAKQQAALNKQLRRELLKFTSARLGGRKATPEQPERERDDERDVPDLIDEMSAMGKISLDD